MQSNRRASSRLLGRRALLGALGGLAGAGLAAPNVARAQQRPFEGQTLRVQFWAGPEGQNIRTGVVVPFQQKTGARVIVTEGGTENSLSKMRAEARNPSTSVYFVDDRAVVVGHREGLLEELDYTKIPNAAAVDRKFFITGHENFGVGFWGYHTTLVYNTNLVREAPTSWNVLWDPRYRGKIAIPPGTIGSSMWLAIMAAMLNGGDQFRMAPAWDALRRLRPHVAYMEANTATLAELLRNEEIALSMRPPLYMKEYIERGYPIGVANDVREGMFFGLACGVIAKGHPDRRDVAEAFINESLEAANQLEMARRLWFVPTNRNVTLPPEIARNVPATEEARSRLIVVDLENQATQREEWIREYTRATS